MLGQTHSESTHGKSDYLTLLKQCLTASVYEESGWQVIPGERRPEQRSLRTPLRYARSLVRSWVVHWLNRRSLMLVKRMPLNRQARTNGTDWPCFGYTMVGHKRLDNVQWCVEEVVRQNVPGDVVECGVWRGGVGMLMRAVLKSLGEKNRRVWLADSFEGLPPPAFPHDANSADLSEVDYMKVSLEQVKQNFEAFGLLDEQCCFVKGWFKDSLPNAPIKDVAVLRLDGDLYASTMDAMESMYYRVSPGGFVIIDDYGSWPSCRAAVRDFFAAGGKAEPPIQWIDKDGVFWRVPKDDSLKVSREQSEIRGTTPGGV